MLNYLTYFTSITSAASNILLNGLLNTFQLLTNLHDPIVKFYSSDGLSCKRLFFEFAQMLRKCQVLIGAAGAVVQHDEIYDAQFFLKSWTAVSAKICNFMVA